MTKEQECMKALQCLYLEVPSVIADDIKQKVIDALNEVKNCTIPLVTNRTYSVDEVKILLEKQKQACANEFIHGEMSMELAKRKVLQTPIVSF